MEEKQPTESTGFVLDITDISYDAKPFEYSSNGTGTSCTLGVRPWPDSMTEAMLQRDGILVRADENCKKFIYCLKYWKDVFDANGAGIRCTDEIKKKIFDFKVDPGMIAFVLEKAAEIKQRKKDEEKNS